jgi:hypothetical protein
MKLLKSALVNISLICAALVICYFVMELAFRLFLPHLPLRYHGYLPTPIQILAQSSKAKTIPNDYIALVGDSYAQGQGHWLWTANEWKNDDYGPQHLIHNKSGLDVITFARGGAGSVAGIVAKPINFLEYLNNSWFYSLPQPKEIIVFFYDNDLNNNISHLEELYWPNRNFGELFTDHVFDQFVEEIAIKEDNSYKPIKRFRKYEHLIFYTFIKNMLDHNDNKPNPKKTRPPGQTNRALIRGSIVALPDTLQSPAIELSKEERSLSLQVLKQSLRYLRQEFNEASISLVYVPSPLACYELVSEKVNIQAYHSKDYMHDTKDIVNLSDEIAFEVEVIANSLGIQYFDSRMALRSAAQKEFIHGPIDWGHLNKVGYTALIDSILERELINL